MNSYYFHKGSIQIMESEIFIHLFTFLVNLLFFVELAVMKDECEDGYTKNGGMGMVHSNRADFFHI